MHLDPRYLAYRWLRQNVRTAREGPEEHAQWATFLDQRFGVSVNDKGSYIGGTVPNPHRSQIQRKVSPDVTFSTAWKDEGFRRKVQGEFEAWLGRLKERPRPSRSHEERMQDEKSVVDSARSGKVTDKKALGQDTVNDVFKVKIDDKDFIFKPSTGSREKLMRERGVDRARIGIDQDRQHHREQAFYELDKMLGEGGVVPPSAMREDGKETDGSYQQFVEATPLLLGLGELPKIVTSDDLAKNPSFQRLQLLDLIGGHEDRHANNVMYYFDGKPSAKNLKFVAIDNGLSAADPSKTEALDDYHYVDAFSTWFDPTDVDTGPEGEPEWATVPNGPEQFEDEWKDVALSGQQAVEEVTSTIPEDMHRKLSQVKLGDFVESQMEAGLEPSAAKAAAVRLAALQADPHAFGIFLEMTDGNYKEAWREFQHWSGHMPDKLLHSAGAKKKLKEIDEAVSSRGSKKKSIKHSFDEGHRVSHADLEPIVEAGKKALREKFGVEEADHLISNIKDEPHLELVDPVEFHKLVEDEEKQGSSRKEAQRAVQQQIQALSPDANFDIGKLDSTAKDGDRHFHMNVQWPEANKMRRRLGLDHKDFHVPVGIKSHAK